MSSLLNAPAYDEPREKRRTKLIWIGIVILLLLLAGLYRMRNWTYERTVDNFFTRIEQKDFEAAYAIYQADPDWKSHPEKYKNYSFGQFYLDWGPSGDWGPIKSHHQMCAARIGTGVIVATTINGRPEPAYMWVETKDHTMTVAPSHLRLECGGVWKYLRDLTR
ncbi:MAG: hypothetical protein M3P27_13500 [Acidobacteriota bacterium]|nr:hypothetical protein [Acidobacteriota bacterium]